MTNPKVEILALCNYAAFSKSGGLSIIDIFDEIYAEHMPTTFARCAIALVLATNQVNSPLFLTVKILNPKGKVTLKKDVQLLTGQNGKGNFILDIVGLELSMIGEYKITVTFGQLELGSIVFRVIKTGKEKALNPRKKKLVN